MATVEKITAWSYSRLSTYLLCPFKAMLLYIKKMKEPGSQAMDRGAAIHKEAENFIKGKARIVPDALKLFATEFKAIRKLKAQVEQQWAFRTDWTITGWFDRDVYVRIVIDAYYMVGDVMYVVDHKTGKSTPDDEQLSLYALAVFKKFPEVNKVVACYWFIDQQDPEDPKRGRKVEVKFNREDDEVRLQKHWDKKALPMLKDSKFPARANDKCRFCHFAKAKGGPCKM